MKNVSVLFVCLGNICRSPTADAVFQQKIKNAGLERFVEVDSAGTSDWHIGKSPDSRSQQHAKKRGYDMSMLRARQAIVEDFSKYDYIFAMDKANLANLKALKHEYEKDGSVFEGHLGLMLELIDDGDYIEVPDPYYEGAAGFELVLDLLENASDQLLKKIQS